MTTTAEYKEPKYIYRYPPCPVYDVEAAESWLTDMARKGLLLSSDGLFLGFAIFVEALPGHYHYRLEAVERTNSIWDDDPNATQEAQELNASFGWEYVTRWGEFYVYRSADAAPREMNTDPQVQALSLKRVEKQLRSALFNSVFWFAIYPLVLIRGCLLLTAINLGTPLLLVWILICVRDIIKSIRLIGIARNLRKRLREGEHLTHKADWRIGARRHYMGTILTVFEVLFILITLGRIFLYSVDQDKIPLTEWAHPLPFAVAEQLVDDGIYKPDAGTPFNHYNLLRYWQDILAPENYTYDATGSVILPDGRHCSIIVQVEYNRLRTDWLAARAAKEYLIQGKRQTKRYEDRFEQVSPMPELNADYVVGYYGTLHSPIVILQKGNVVVHAYLHTSGLENGEQIPLEQWASILADSL